MDGFLNSKDIIQSFHLLVSSLNIFRRPEISSEGQNSDMKNDLLLLLFIPSSAD